MQGEPNAQMRKSILPLARRNESQATELQCGFISRLRVRVGGGMAREVRLTPRVG